MIIKKIYFSKKCQIIQQRLRLINKGTVKTVGKGIMEMVKKGK